MAIRRQRLRHRVAGLGSNMARSHAQHGAVTTQLQPAMGSAHPPVPALAPVTPMVMPLAQVIVVAPPGSQYVTVGYRDLPGIYAPGGEMIPSTSPGGWGQLIPAGRM